MFIRVLQRKEPIGDMYVYQYIWIGSCSYGGWVGPWSAICKLEKQIFLFQIPFKFYLNPKAQKSGVHMSEGRRRWMSQLNQTEILPSSHLFILVKPSTDWMISTHPKVRILVFTQSTGSNANPFWKHPHWPHSIVMFYWLFGHPSTQSSAQIKLAMTGAIIGFINNMTSDIHLQAFMGLALCEPFYIHDFISSSQQPRVPGTV